MSSQSYPSCFARLSRFDRSLRDGDPGTMHASARRIFKPCTPSWSDLQNVVAGFQSQLFETGQTSWLCEIERFRGIREDPLSVARRLGVKEAQEEFRINLIMRGNGGLVCPQLAEQQWLQEAPRRHERVQITHLLPQRKRPQHVAIDVDVARQIRVSKLHLVKTGDCAHRVPVLQGDTEVRRALTETSDRPSGKSISNGTSVRANTRPMRFSQNPAEATSGA
jgi:hypothetical protein